MCMCIITMCVYMFTTMQLFCLWVYALSCNFRWICAYASADIFAYSVIVVCMCCVHVYICLPTCSCFGVLVGKCGTHVSVCVCKLNIVPHG